jgi:hypothetical protein
LACRSAVVRFRLERRESAYPVPRAAVAAGVVLAVLGLVAAAAPGLAEGPVLCPFRAATGLPCPGCGLMRSAHSLFGGKVARAVAVNPLAAVLLLTGLPAMALLVATNRKGGLAVRVEASRAERRALWTILCVLVAANWVYVLASHA